MITNYDNIGFIPEIQVINVINHISGNKDKNHMIISINGRKAFDKIQHALLIKVLDKIELEETCLNIVIAKYEIPTTNIVLNRGKT
jgi:DNA polymerase IIIc chi subunit